MLHNRIASDIRSHFSTVGPSPQEQHVSGSVMQVVSRSGRPDGVSNLLLLPKPPVAVEADDAGSRQSAPSVFHDLITAGAHRCASFFAEAAVLVLVLGILDRFMLKGRIELRWIAGALFVTTALLAASIATDVSARRWLRAH